MIRLGCSLGGPNSKHHLHQGVAGELPIEIVQLLLGGGADGAGNGEVLAAAGGTHLHAFGHEVRCVAQDNVHHDLGEVVRAAAHDLDGEVAGEFQQGVSSFIRSSLRPDATAVVASPKLNEILSRFRNKGKADDIALITNGRAESQKIEQYYVGHRYYFTSEMLRLDPELTAYSLVLLLHSPELFRYGKGRYAQDVISLIGLVLQQLAQEFQALHKTGSAA